MTAGYLNPSKAANKKVNSSKTVVSASGREEYNFSTVHCPASRMHEYDVFKMDF